MSLFEIFSNVVDTVVGFGKEVLKLGSDVIESIGSAAKEFAKDVVENIGKAIETVSETFSKLTETVIEIGGAIVEGVGKVLDIVDLGLQELVSGIVEIGKCVVDMVKEHPAECISIMTSIIGAVTCFVSGNIAQGIVFLSSGIMKGVKLISELPEEERERYSQNMPEKFMSLYEKHDLANKSYESLDYYSYELSNKCLPELTDNDGI